MKIMFVNSRDPKCGVHQYGVSLYSVIKHHIGPSEEHSIFYSVFVDGAAFLDGYDQLKPDVVIYNWQAGIGGWMGEAPFSDIKAFQVLAYHDLESRFPDFDVVLFSDPTMPQHDNWHPIGRPLRSQISIPIRNSEVPNIGINGFIGAWANTALAAISHHFEKCHIRLHLPYATYGDSGGVMARASAEHCISSMPNGFSWEVSHDFMEWDDLVMWLSKNDVNCYFRDVGMNWRGVSSSCDAAMCARRPIAVNACNAFRHLHDCSPSIQIEHRTLKEIIETGLSPLAKKYQEYAPDVVGGQVMKVLESLFNKA